MEEWTVPGWGAVGVLVALLVLLAVTGLALRRLHALRRQLRGVRADQQAVAESLAALQERVATLERRPGRTGAEEPEYLITSVGDAAPTTDPTTPRGAPTEVVSRPDGPLFADLVLRETVVQAASLAHGVRRALAPEVRHRIRFEMRRELKRARKQRRIDQREARREWQARQRAGLGVEGSGDSAA